MGKDKDKDKRGLCIYVFGIPVWEGPKCREDTHKKNTADRKANDEHDLADDALQDAYKLDALEAKRGDDDDLDPNKGEGKGKGKGRAKADDSSSTVLYIVGAAAALGGGFLLYSRR